jgi:hypothetical protein
MVSRFHEDDEQGNANAALMAKAPEMLEAIQGALRIVELWGPPELSIEEAAHADEYAALSKMRRSFCKILDELGIEHC